VSSQQGERVFFEGSAYLPKDTPDQIAKERAEELKALQVRRQTSARCIIPGFGQSLTATAALSVPIGRPCCWQPRSVLLLSYVGVIAGSNPALPCACSCCCCAHAFAVLLLLAVPAAAGPGWQLQHLQDVQVRGEPTSTSSTSPSKLLSRLQCCAVLCCACQSVALLLLLLRDRHYSTACDCLFRCSLTAAHHLLLLLLFQLFCPALLGV
jgi:hypothetical protein